MSIGRPIFYLNNKAGREPINWSEIKTRVSFVFTDTVTGNRISESNQPSIDTDTFTYTGIAAKEIIAYRKAGLTGGVGIFEGMPVRREVSNGATTITDFNGYIDFKGEYLEISSEKVKVTIKSLDGLNSFQDRATVNTFEFLEFKKVFKKSDYIDIPFIVQPLDRESQLVTLRLTITMFAIQGASLVKEIFKDIGIIGAIGSTVLGVPGSLILAVVMLALDIAFLILLVAQIGKLMLEMARLLVPPVMFQKGMFIKDLLEKAIDFLGYKFETGIDELATTAYMPAKGSGDNTILSGVPKIGEPGETVSKLINIALRIGNARIGIIDGTVHIRTKSDPFWVKDSTYVLPDVGNSDSSALDLESELFVPNTSEMKGTTVLGFATDSNEQWTLEDDEGIDVQAIREPIAVNDKTGKMVLINGFEDIKIPLTLASSKTESSEIEDFFEDVIRKMKPLLDQVNLIYGNQIGANLNNLGPSIPTVVGTILNLFKSRQNVVKISGKAYSVPKLVPLINVAVAPFRPSYRMPTNPRDVFSALPLYKKYYLSDSFADTNPGIRQRILFSRKIAFTFDDLIKLRLNSYFATHDGKRGKMEFIEWQLDADEADVKYWIEEQYSNNITEITISTL